jgi:hypothetical protein
MIDIPDRIVAVLWIYTSQDLYRCPIEPDISLATPVGDLLACHGIVQRIREMGSSVVVPFLIRRRSFHPITLVCTLSRRVVNPGSVHIFAMGASNDVDVIDVQIPSFVRCLKISRLRATGAGTYGELVIWRASW